MQGGQSCSYFKILLCNKYKLIILNILLSYCTFCFVFIETIKYTEERISMLWNRQDIRIKIHIWTRVAMFAIFSYNFYIYLSQAVLFTKMLCFLQSLDNSVLTQVIRVHYSNCYNISVLNILRIYLFFIPLFMLLYICVSFLYYHLIIFNLFGNKN